MKDNRLSLLIIYNLFIFNVNNMTKIQAAFEAADFLRIPATSQTAWILAILSTLDMNELHIVSKLRRLSFI